MEIKSIDQEKTESDDLEIEEEDCEKFNIPILPNRFGQTTFEFILEYDLKHLTDTMMSVYDY